MEPSLQTHTNRIGKRGAWVVPASLRQFYGLREGALVIAEPRPDGILLKPAVATSTLQTPASVLVWKEWFELMSQVKATPEEIAGWKAEGRP